MYWRVLLYFLFCISLSLDFVILSKVGVLFRVYICYYNLHSILYTKSQIVISQVLIFPLNFYCSLWNLSYISYNLYE